MNLETVIKHTLLDLPVYCTADVETHDWVITYANPFERGLGRHSLNSPTVQRPHYICRYCYAISENWTTNRYPKRAR